MRLPFLAISVRQPWAWMIIHAGKDIENRTWPTKFRGRVLIHAAKGMTREEYNDAAFEVRMVHRIVIPEFESLNRGGVIGSVEIVDCVSESDSPWFGGPFGFVLRSPEPMEFRPCRGALGFFKPYVSSL